MIVKFLGIGNFEILKCYAGFLIDFKNGKRLSLGMSTHEGWIVFGEIDGYDDLVPDFELSWQNSRQTYDHVWTARKTWSPHEQRWVCLPYTSVLTGFQYRKPVRNTRFFGSLKLVIGEQE